ncbi:hypothetical protein OIE63_15460 [Streptomyces sp. NBC_01795]|uniref:hypothetical protein n=1 Tax=Streptomyces sp. NBC_01795 TaxID=2975943 RepID=UPI002DD99D48|nr:hypothetical protein [Streptomyces sp. NBC_01795]WSA92805.1 hypothetical protein OIE63_15460 [Streptomyces sp. NBC_01795]
MLLTAAVVLAGTVAASAASAAPAHRTPHGPGRAAPHTGADADADKRGAGRGDEARLYGSAKMHRADGQRVRFAFDARGFGDAATEQGTSRGTFRFSHYTPDGSSGAWAKGRIDCLTTGGGKVATATGIVTETDLEGLKGKRVGFTVQDDGRHDHLGYSWASGNPQEMDVAPCLSAAPYETVEKGDFTVHHKLPPAPQE